VIPVQPIEHPIPSSDPSSQTSFPTTQKSPQKEQSEGKPAQNQPASTTQAFEHPSPFIKSPSSQNSVYAPAELFKPFPQS